MKGINYIQVAIDTPNKPLFEVFQCPYHPSMTAQDVMKLFNIWKSWIKG